MYTIIQIQNEMYEYVIDRTHCLYIAKRIFLTFKYTVTFTY